MTRLPVFGPDSRPAAGPEAAGPEAADTIRLRVLITARAGMNPGHHPDEIAYAVGLNTDPHRPDWIRLGPMQDGETGEGEWPRLYDIVAIDARPACPDPRPESWRPVARTMRPEDHLKHWHARRRWLDPRVEDSMCRLSRGARDRPQARSLALVRPRDVDGLRITAHPGWTPEDERRLDSYVRRVGPTAEREPLAPAAPRLAAPRFEGAYRYRCHERDCAGHDQRIVDWEFAAMQRRLTDLSDDRLRRTLQTNFVDRMCGADRDVAFYVGNRADQPYLFDVLGTYWPPRRVDGPTIV